MTLLKIRDIATCAMASSAVESFTIDSMIRGYHVYKDVWSSFIGEMLYYRCDVRNHHDPFAIKGRLQWDTCLERYLQLVMCFWEPEHKLYILRTRRIYDLCPGIKFCKPTVSRIIRTS